MSNRPGGEISRRPLHFIWIADCSGSMALDGKIQALNTAIREALPHMREVQRENPQAEVMMQTLRFSSGARWVEPTPVPLETFQWTDLAADELAQTVANAAEFRSRLTREGAQTGDVQVSLIWNNHNDLDLHVVCPSSEEIYFANRNSRCGGKLDVDMNVSPTSAQPVENVFWPRGGAPMGRYQVYVHHYKNHRLPDCRDPTHFWVKLKIHGLEQEFSGSISHGRERYHVHSFDLTPMTAASGQQGGGNTDMGKALTMVADQLKIPPMSSRALPPVLVLISDGQPTDDFNAGMQSLVAQAWGKKAVRISIAIGQDADLTSLEQFIGHSELRPLEARNAEALVRFIRWASTAVLQSASSPASQAVGGRGGGLHIPIPTPPPTMPSSASDPW